MFRFPATCPCSSAGRRCASGCWSPWRTTESAPWNGAEMRCGRCKPRFRAFGRNVGQRRAVSGRFRRADRRAESAYKLVGLNTLSNSAGTRSVLQPTHPPVNVPRRTPRDRRLTGIHFSQKRSLWLMLFGLSSSFSFARLRFRSTACTEIDFVVSTVWICLLCCGAGA